jgi:integrase
MTPDQARDLARKAQLEVAAGRDPMGEIQDRRTAPTLGEVAGRYIEEEVALKRKPATAALYRIYLRRQVVPTLGKKQAATVSFEDVERAHKAIGAESPVTANRVLNFLSGVFTWAAKRRIVEAGHNPAKGHERFAEKAAERFLSTEELKRLGEAIREAETVGVPWRVDRAKPKGKHIAREENARTVIEPEAAAAMRLLLLTGARLREILDLKWSEVDFERGMLLLEDSKTGRKPIVLNAPALAVLAGLPREGVYVIKGASAGGVEKPRADLKRPWRLVTRRAGLEGLRIHDLRHSFAAFGAGGGMGLPVLGKLLGHRSVETTQRYAHLAEDPVRRASETIGATVAAALGEPATAAGEVVPLRRGR